MYKRRTPGAKRDPAKQWALPDRVFFAAGACHILAYVFLEQYPHGGFEAKWIRPAPGHTGNHIVVVRDDGCVFDYHGFSDWPRYWTHAVRFLQKFSAPPADHKPASEQLVLRPQAGCGREPYARPAAECPAMRCHSSSSSGPATSTSSACPRTPVKNRGR